MSRKVEDHLSEHGLYVTKIYEKRSLELEIYM